MGGVSVESVRTVWGKLGGVENPIHDPNPLLAGWTGSSACMGRADGHLGPWVKG